MWIWKLRRFLPRCIRRTSGASWLWYRRSAYPVPAWYPETLYHRAAPESREPSLYLPRNIVKHLPVGPEDSPRCRVSPVFPMIFSHGWSVTMLSSKGEMSGVRDHSLTVLSLLQLAMVKGRLWWQVKPAGAGQTECWEEDLCWSDGVKICIIRVNNDWIEIKF